MALITFCAAPSNGLISLYSLNKQFAMRFSPCPNLRTDWVCLAGTDGCLVETLLLSVGAFNCYKNDLLEDSFDSTKPNFHFLVILLSLMLKDFLKMHF